MAGDWIKLHRKILEHWVFRSPDVFKLWTYLLMSANWKPGKCWFGGSSAPVPVERGQLITGRRSLHSALYPEFDREGERIVYETPPPHPTTVWRWLLAIEADGMVSLDVRHHFTVVSVCNYEIYQSVDEPDAPTVRQPCANRAPTVRTIEEGKEGEEGKKDTPPTPRGGVWAGFAEFWNAYPRKTAKQAALKAWNRLRPDDTLRGVLLAALGQQVHSAQWQRGVIPHASTWLNQRRWEDVLGYTNGTPSKPQETPAERTARIARERAEELARSEPETVRELWEQRRGRGK